MSSRSFGVPLVVALCLLVAGAARAQYRPPPMSDAERLIAEGDEARVEAAKAASFGEKEKTRAKLEQAIAAYEKALAADPKAVAAATGLGLACAQLKDWDRIVKVLTPLQADNPQDVDLAHQLGVALLKKRRYAEAAALLEVAGASDRTDLFINQYYQGWLALQRGDGARVVSELQRYLKQRPPEVAENDRDIQEVLGKGHLLLKDAPRARAAFEAAQKGRPEAAGPQLGLAAVLELEGKQADAVKLLERLNTKFPKAPEPKERLARLQLALGNLKRAEALTGELLGLQDSVPAHLLMADVQLALKQLPAAEREYKAALKRAPLLPGALVGLANVLQAQGRHDEAIRGLAQASAEKPDHPELLAALGRVYRRAGKPEPAIATHLNLVKVTNGDPGAQLLLAADYFAGAQWDQAVATYSAVLDARPGTPAARKWLVVALQRRAQARTEAGLLDDAVRDLRRAFELERSVVTARSLGALLLSKGQFADARTVLDGAGELPGAGWSEPYLLGWAALGAGDAKAANAAFEAAQAQTKDPHAAAEIGAGWALARLESGDLDAAIKRLAETQARSKAAEANLPLALLRRSLDRLREGNTGGAQSDFEAVAKLKRRPELESLTELVRGFLALESNRGDLALAAFKRALPPADKTPVAAATRVFLEAYVEYRRDRTLEAKKKLVLARKVAKDEAWGDFARANARRDGELAYAVGAMPRAEKSLREALLASDPANPYVMHNLACVQYRRGGSAQALGTWKSLVGAVPEATLNLGIVAQGTKDPRRAAAYYSQYLSTRGSYTGLAREWRDRLEAIYGSAGDSAGEEATQ